MDQAPLPDQMTHFASTFHNSHDYFPENPVYKGRVIRAKCMKDGHIDSPVSTHVFFIKSEYAPSYTLPIINISINPDYLFDYHTGIYTAGIVFDNWRIENPEVNAQASTPANYNQKGSLWEKPANFIYFCAESDTATVNFEAGIRIHGGITRSYPIKSLRIYNNSVSKNPNQNLPLFTTNNSQPLKSFLLRNSGNDWAHTYFKDAVLQKVISSLHFDTQDYQPSVVFLNGEYWGIHNIREYYDKYYFQRVYQIKPSELDFLERNGLVMEGSNQHYLETIEYTQHNDLAEDTHYQHIQTRIDIENFIDYYAANMFIVNTDWPGNNIKFFRKQTIEYEPQSPPGQDGRWRWVILDLDAAFGLFDPSYHRNMLEYTVGNTGAAWQNPEWPTFLFKNLLKNKSFETRFITRFTDLLNTCFLPEYIIQQINSFENTLEPEMPMHISRWKKPSDFAFWKEKTEYIKDYAIQRHPFQKEHLKSFFQLGSYINIDFDVSNSHHGLIRMNSIDLKTGTPGVPESIYPWTGFYYQNFPIELQAIPNEGYEFSHWEGSSNSTQSKLNLSPSKNLRLKAHFSKKDKPEILYAWTFDAKIPNDTPLQSITSTYQLKTHALLEFHSALEGYPFAAQHPLWRKASMERRNFPTPINYYPNANNNLTYEEANIKGLQIKQPFKGNAGENTLIFHTSTQGFKDILLCFAAISEDESITEILIEYSTESVIETWKSIHVFNVNADYKLFEADFKDLLQANDNPDFKIRIKFISKYPYQDEGKRITFNNICLLGHSIEEESSKDTTFKLFPNPATNGFIQLSQPSNIQVFNSCGMLVLKENNTTRIALAGFASGVYLIFDDRGNKHKFIVINQP